MGKIFSQRAPPRAMRPFAQSAPCAVRRRRGGRLPLSKGSQSRLRRRRTAALPAGQFGGMFDGKFDGSKGRSKGKGLFPVVLLTGGTEPQGAGGVFLLLLLLRQGDPEQKVVDGAQLA